MYNIQSQQDYQQRIIPPSPERPSSPPVRSAALSRWGPSSVSLLESLAASLSARQGILFCSSMLQTGLFNAALLKDWHVRLGVRAVPYADVESSAICSCPTHHGTQQGWPHAVLTSDERCQQSVNTFAVTFS